MTMNPKYSKYAVTIIFNQVNKAAIRWFSTSFRLIHGTLKILREIL